MAEITKDSTFEEAYRSIQGTRALLVAKFKPFIEESFTIEDLYSVADQAIVVAFKEWNPKLSKFNTFAHNYISWTINKFLCSQNTIFKTNAITTYELTQEGQSFAEVKKAGKTKNEDFNEWIFRDEGFVLDGSDEAKKRINRNVYNAFISYESKIRRPQTFRVASSFSSKDGAEDFDIIDVASPDMGVEGVFEYGGFSKDRYDMDDEIAHMDSDKATVVKRIIAGVPIGEIAKEFGLTQTALMQRFAPESSGTKGKAKMARAAAKMEFLAAQRAKKAQREAEIA